MEQRPVELAAGQAHADQPRADRRLLDGDRPGVGERAEPLLAAGRVVGGRREHVLTRRQVGDVDGHRRTGTACRPSSPRR